MTLHVNTARLKGATALRSAFAAPPEPAPSATEPAELVNQLTKAFEDFKAANDERIAALEKGRDDVVSQEKVDRINGEISKLQNALETANTLQKRVDELELRNARPGIGHNGGPAIEDQVAYFNRAGAGLGAAVGANPIDATGYADYTRAFWALVKANGVSDRLPAEIRAAASVGIDSEGGYLAPAEMSMELEKRVFETSPMRQIARVISIGRKAWEAPYRSSKGTSGGWVGEKTARTATATPNYGMQTITAHGQYAYPEMTQDSLEDPVVDLQGDIVTETEEEMSRTENTGFVTGDGNMKPRGFLDYGAAAVTTDDATRDWGVLQYVASGAAGAWPAYSGTAADDPGALIDLMATLNPVYRPGATWAMNRSTEANIRKLRDADGRYLVGLGQLGDAAFGFTLHGFGITNLEDMPDIAANSFSVAFGNFRRGYYIVDRRGFSLLVDPYTNKPYVGFYITKRTGGDVRNFDAIKLLKFAAS